MRFVLPMVALAWLSALAGCAHADTAADRHFARLNDSVGKVQAEQDRAARLGALEDEEGGAAPPPPRPTAAPASRPTRTVQIGSDGDGTESDDPNDPTARPEIRLQGPAGAASRERRSKSARAKGEARIEPSGPDDGPRSDAARPSILDPEAKQAYEHARGLVTDKKYDRALEALTAFIIRWPDHPYVENALYWRGEVHFARSEHLRAAEQFEAVVAKGGNKTPDALLKIGMCHDRLGSADRAKEYWERLRRDYPRSDAAKKLPQSGEAPRSRGPKESR